MLRYKQLSMMKAIGNQVSVMNKLLNDALRAKGYAGPDIKMVLTDVTDPKGPYYTDTLTNIVVFDRKELAKSNRDQILNALGHEFGHYSKEDNKTGNQTIANYSGEKLEDRTKGMVSKEATEDTLARIRNNKNVITGEEGKKLADSIPKNRREYSIYLGERPVKGVKFAAHSFIPVFPNIQSDFFEKDGTVKEEFKFLGEPIQLKNGKRGWIVAGYNGEKDKGEAGGRLVLRINDPSDIRPFKLALESNNNSEEGYIVQQITSDIENDTEPAKKILLNSKRYIENENYVDYNMFIRNCHSISFSLIEPIEKKVITNRILPISRGRGEVEYLKFKRFVPGTE
ncbi:hypothetical protein [Fusobacterium nucleatum]|uniref:hypothetical protein n=1 Tax=Fusobacterium nucleatum TaxID=851 RepID=UPI0030CB0624